MKIIGLTGGMGAGKSTVADLFAEKGFPIYTSDTRAKDLMVEDNELKKKLIQLLGKEAYTLNGDINRAYIAQKIFSDKELLQQQNHWVHSAVREDFNQWIKKQKTQYCIKEAAILFESGAYKDCDFTIIVTAPDDIRIQRILKRDSISEEEIKKRLQNQWKQEELIKLSDYHITNDSDIENLKVQVEKIILNIKKK